jgi:hypothetical protein
MGLGNNRPGFNSVGEYTISGLPWVTSSIASSTVQQWNFHHVTREVNVMNFGSGSLGVGFSAPGMLDGHQFMLPPSASINFNVRTTQLYVRAIDGTPQYSIFASLTLVAAGDMPPLSGSGNWPGI